VFYKRYFNKFQAELKQFASQVLNAGWSHSTTRSFLFSLLLVLLISAVHLNPGLSVRFRLGEEQVRHWLWYFTADEYKSPSIPLVVLDLYTSETFNASEELYDERYQSYELSRSMTLFCRLGATKVIFDTFLDKDSWMGRHLLSAPDDLKELIKALNCFKEVFLPVRDKPENSFIYPLEPIRDLKQVKYVHVNTMNSRLYEPLQLFVDEKMSISFPYSAVAMVKAIQPDWTIDISRYPHQKLPLQFGYHPRAFPRASYKELSQLLEVMDLMGPEELKELYPVYFKDAELPDFVLVGYTHDSTDQHDLPYTKAGPIYLTHSPSSEGSEGSFGESARETQGIGEEPPVLFTPGLYAILSTASTLAEGDLPLYPFHDWLLVGLLLLGLLFWFSVEWGRNLDSNAGRLVFFLMLTLAFLVVYGVTFLYEVYVPLFLPLIGLLGCLVMSGILYRRELIRKLVRNYGSVQDDEKQESSIQKQGVQQPLIIHQAQAALDLQTDPYGILISKIDLVECWIQYLGLLMLSDYIYHQHQYSPIPQDNWRFSLKRTSLGHYLGAISQFGKNFSDDVEAERSFFPQFYHLLTGMGSKKKKQQPFEAALERIVGIRNHWKHEKSSSNPRDEIESTLVELNEIQEKMNESLRFLTDYSLIRPIKIREVTEDQQTWQSQFYNGNYCGLGEIKTANQLSTEDFYLYSHHRVGELQGSALKLSPWIIGQECKFHHREELFFYSGVNKNQCVYSGLTKHCSPTITPAFPQDIGPFEAS